MFSFSLAVLSYDQEFQQPIYCSSNSPTIQTSLQPVRQYACAREITNLNQIIEIVSQRCTTYLPLRHFPKPCARDAVMHERAGPGTYMSPNWIRASVEKSTDLASVSPPACPSGRSAGVSSAPIADSAAVPRSGFFQASSRLLRRPKITHRKE